ncbi:DUF3800 domain-containing protein [Microbispora sp. KK1-11]|uniref:DUF3800 domain-containing protein n=1 Tax=Microbispora sp. KK1-11 TaxID=2053005 RepID=UPI001158311D|nr:DUF3800 domain-containing protein [Microbispora sp. KK1-11]
MYADETGDMGVPGISGVSRYFGCGTAVFRGEHGERIWQGLRLRCDLERRGVSLPKGRHAKDDSQSTRDEVFDVIKDQRPRIDATFLYKGNAHPSVRERQQWLYKLAWFSHFRQIVSQVSGPGDTLYVIAASLTTSRKVMNAREALRDVCGQFDADREIVLCVWDAQSTWGIQVADYSLWAVQRHLENRPCKWFESHVKPNVRSLLTPWGRHE